MAGFLSICPSFFPREYAPRARVSASISAVCWPPEAPYGQGSLMQYYGGNYAKAGAVVTLVYLLGMGLIWLAP